MKKPNILLITTDQQRFDTLQTGGYPARGNSHIRTPHLNYLMDTGIHYTNSYSDCPICMPSRATIMSGQHGYTMGVVNNSPHPLPLNSDLTLPGLLTKAGYQTRAIGKMHFEPTRCHFGFEHMELLEDYYRHMAKNPQFGVPMAHGLGQNEIDLAFSTVDEAHSLTSWTVDRTIDFLETRDESRPFFAWTSFSKPHPPFDPDRNYYDLYRDKNVGDPVYGDWSEKAEDVPDALRMHTYINNSFERFGKEAARDSKRAYYAMITQVDYSLGRLFGRLRELGELENTMIIFTSDHGDLMGDHHMAWKGLFLEGSAHVPLIVKPAYAHLPVEARELGGKSCDHLVNHADLLPTCLAAAGILPPKELNCEGFDLIKNIEGESPRKSLIGNFSHHHMVRDDQYKYMYTSLDGIELLFDMQNDPMEQRELIRTGLHEDVRKRMRKKLIESLTRRGHEAVKNGNLVITGKAPSYKEIKRSPWPGFHTTAERSDVLH